MFLWIFIWGLYFREIDAGKCTQSYACQHTCYSLRKYNADCGFWGWKSCTRYRSHGYKCRRTCYKSVCCTGYTGSYCNTPLCFGSTTCPNGGRCMNPDECHCLTGYSLPSCADINECSYTTHGCQHSCINTHGSYNCSCRLGYTLDSDLKSCHDVNECNTNNGGCEHMCKNNIGSYTCDCADGYRLNTDRKTCSDVNECALGTSGCEQVCNNTVGSYTCLCNSGYVLAIDGRKCEDIDECSLQSNQCTDYCQNTQGSYFCYCDKGFEINPDGFSCQDEDECLKVNKTCDQTCINVVGSYKCECHSGYTMKDTSFAENTCHDVDECGENSPGCSQICNNTDGSYFCDCHIGYSLDNDNKTCLDIDDCERIVCHNGGSCVDRLDSYTCICNEGFGGALCETDINECEILNGGCQDICVNTVGSLKCICSEGRELNEDGFTCKGENTITVFERLQIPRQLLPKACFTVKLVECTDGRNGDIFLSSTSEWYQLTSDPNVVYTHGVVFVKNVFSLPVSLRGVEFTKRSEGFTLNYDVHYVSAKGTVIRNDLTPADCQAIELVNNDLFDFISVDSFTKTFLLSLRPALPDWLEFEKSGTDILAVQDIKSDLVNGRNMNEVTWCAGAPVLPNHLYTVFKFDTGLKVIVLGDAIDLPKPLQSRKFCLIVDLCQSNGGTVFLMIPEESRDVLVELNIFKTLKEEHNIFIQPSGFGISLVNGVNAGYHSFSSELWNGYRMFMPPLPQDDFWIGGKLLKNDRYFTVDGNADIYMGIPSVQKMLTSMFREKRTAVIDVKLSLSPVLRFKLIGKEYSINLPFATASVSAYASIGGSKRMLCGDVSNPEGVFLSTIVDIHPFKGIPYLEYLGPQLLNRMYFFVTDIRLNPSGRNSFRITDRILEIESLLNNTMAILDDALGNIVPFQEMLIEMRLTINTIRGILSRKSGEFTSVHIENYVGSFEEIRQQVHRFRSTLYNLADKTEFIVSKATKRLVELLHSQTFLLTKSIRDVFHDMTKNILSSDGNYTGFGFRFTGHWTIFGLDLFWFDIEIVYSEEELFRCSRFDGIRKLLNGESALRVLGRATRKFKLGRFVNYNKGFGIGGAIAINTGNVIVQLQAVINMLGTEVTVDLFISINGINFYLEFYVWDLFLAQIDVSAKVGKEWYQLIFNLQGRFVADAKKKRSVESSRSLVQSKYVDGFNLRGKRQVHTTRSSFQNSYLDALIKNVGFISEMAEKRLSQVQSALLVAKRSVSKAKNWLAEKLAAVRKANVVFDSAEKILENAKGKLEAAKGPFVEALRKLRKAKKNIDNLCRIRKCSRICIPGIRCKICFKRFWGVNWPYPCCWFTSCMISFPNPFCLLANLACTIIRAAAYLVLEIATITVRTAMLAFDIAKAAVTAAQFVVDKSRVILIVAEGILKTAGIGLEIAEGILEAAQVALEAVKRVIRYAVKVLEFVIKYGLTTVIDVKNCGFNIQLSTTDLPVFDVFCDVNPFRLGWTTIKLRINFKNIFQSLWQAAKATVSAIINIFGGIFSGRKRRDIEFEASIRMHVLLRKIRESNGLNSTDTYMNGTIDIVNDITGFRGKINSDSENRIQLFSEKCKKITVIQDFMQVAFQYLQDVSNESKSNILEIVNVKELLQRYSNLGPSQNISLDKIGISKEYAEKDYNMTESDLQRVVEEIRSAAADDPLLVEIQKAAYVSKQCLEDEAQSVESIDYQNAWFTSMDNITWKYFNTSDCVGFRDCIFYSISCMYDLYEYEDIPNITIIKQSVLELEGKLIEAFQNESSSIQDTSFTMEYVLERINALIEMNSFCAKPPEFLTQLQNQTVFYGNQVQFFCHVRGDPEPSYVWLLNDTVIENENTCRLVLEKVTDENSYDKYNCIAGNVVANITSDDAYVTVVLEDEDECQTENGKCQQFCNNTVGSYFCSCFDGFEPEDQNKYLCKDSNECEKDNGGCQHACTNKVGSFTCSCNGGYILQSDSRTCADVDECKTNNGECQHICTNEAGTFMCSCRNGYELHVDDRTCADINECETNNGGCQHSCSNENGSFKCSCKFGYKLHTDISSCIDINECELNNGGCQHKCTNELGSFSCSCNNGFLLHSDSRACIELSECNLKSSVCQHTCSIEGESFTCLCYDGYEFETDSKSCTDINECEADMSACQHMCFNTDGSFYCTCLEGYLLENDGITCSDVNECELLISKCTHSCINMPGSYECLCRHGYKLENDGITCSDIDECEKGNDGCEHICRNREGSFQCLCSNGFELTMDDKSCADKNECETDNGGCEHKCVNTDGSFKCLCEDGFELEKDVRSCIDVNECETNDNDCEQTCVNTEGSHICSCRDGFRIENDGISCTDINECNTENGGCGHICKNVNGSFECLCNDGYELHADGKHCHDINECDRYNNGGCEQICKNAEGTFTCGCYSGYNLLSDAVSCNDIDECKIRNGNCEHTCFNFVGAYTCLCRLGSVLRSDNKTCTGIGQNYVSSSVRLGVDKATVSDPKVYIAIVSMLKRYFEAEIDGIQSVFINHLRTNNKFFGRENVTVDYTVIYNEDKDVGTMVDEIVNAILKLEAGSTLLLDEKKIHAQGIIPSNLVDSCQLREMLVGPCQDGWHCIIYDGKPSCRINSDESALRLTIRINLERHKRWSYIRKIRHKSP